MFGGMGGGGGRHSHGPRRSGRGEDTRVAYEVTLEDLYNGKTVKMNLERQGLCNHCSG